MGDPAPDGASLPAESAIRTDDCPSTSSSVYASGWAYVVAAGTPAGFASFMLIQSVDLGLGTLSAPGPGMWPFALSVSLVVLSLALLVGWSRFGPCEPWGRGAMRTAVGATSVAPFVLLAPHVGFEIPAAVLLTFWMRALGGETWRLAMSVSVGAVVVLHVLFIEMLDMSIPYLFGL